MQTYLTLDEALQDIASRSFYEGARIERFDNKIWGVSDDANPGEESYVWTYKNGAEYPDELLDHSRVHEAWEFYDEAYHIRYNLSAAVEALEEGKPVIFHYVTLDAYCEDPEPEDCQEDHIAGWALIAFSGQ